MDILITGLGFLIMLYVFIKYIIKAMKLLPHIEWSDKDDPSIISLGIIFLFILVAVLYGIGFLFIGLCK